MRAPLLSLLISLLVAAPCLAQQPTPIVRASLTIEASETPEAAIHFTIPDGWHIYGENPGDTGMPTTFEWALPQGIRAGGIQWPPTETFKEGDFTTYGYQHKTTIRTPLLGTGAGEAKVSVRWLACKDICIPESTTLTAQVNLSSASLPASALPGVSDLFYSLMLAFLGGLILNIMPCVLPILALKALALVKKAQASRMAAATQGLAYTAGVVASFLLIAGGMLALKASGAAIGWGFQLQNAGFVAFLAAVMLLVAANLLGFFELPALLGNRATGVNEDRLRGSFLTGALAVMVATPCTAPFMATAIGATLSMPPIQALAVFAALGLGMAAPFLLISLWPAARRLLPKPGAWMRRFKQVLALPMLATAAWLLFILMQLLAPVKTDYPTGYEAYSAARLSELRANNQPVLVDATAAWCLTCKINERVALKPPSMQAFFRQHAVTILVADWTESDPSITAYLASFGRNGVPLYVYYPSHKDPVLLPQILTPDTVRKAIETNK